MLAKERSRKMEPPGWPAGGLFQLVYRLHVAHPEDVSDDGQTPAPHSKLAARAGYRMVVQDRGKPVNLASGAVDMMDVAVAVQVEQRPVGGVNVHLFDFEPVSRCRDNEPGKYWGIGPVATEQVEFEERVLVQVGCVANCGVCRLS